MSWFGQETFLIIINVENIGAAYASVKTMIFRLRFFILIF